MSFDGLSIQLYHPDMCPVESYAYIDEEGEYQMQTSYMKSYIADDGTVHLVADSTTIREQIKVRPASALGGQGEVGQAELDRGGSFFMSEACPGERIYVGQAEVDRGVAS